MVFTSQQNGASYLAVFNYSANPSVTNVDLSRAGISGAVNALDLWNGSVLPVTGFLLTVPLNAKQGRLFQLLSPIVLQTPQIKPGGEFVFTLVGPAGYSYTFQSSTDLVLWNPVLTISNATGTLQFFTGKSGASNAGFFYRALMLP